MADYEPKSEFEAWWPVGRERWISESASVNDFVEWAFTAGWQQRDDQLRKAALSPDSDGQTRAMRFLPTPVMARRHALTCGATDLEPPDNRDYDWTDAHRPAEPTIKDIRAKFAPPLAPLVAPPGPLEHTESVYDPKRAQYAGPVPTFVKDEDAEDEEYFSG